MNLSKATFPSFEIITVLFEVSNVNFGVLRISIYAVSVISPLDAVIQLTLQCDNYNLNFFSTIISQNNYILPPMTVTSGMIGSCIINATTNSFDQNNETTTLSNQFLLNRHTANIFKYRRK